MTTWAAVHLLAAASGLVVIALSISRGGGSPLRRPLALLAANQFAWNAAALGDELTHLEAFAVLGAIAAPLWPPMAMDFVVSFLGRRKQLRWLTWSAYGVFGTQALFAAIALSIPREQVPDRLQTFALWLL